MGFVNLFGGNQLHVAVLADYASGQKRTIAQLRERETDIPRAGHVLTADAYAGQAEADIEDIIGRATYVELVNRCYDLKGKAQLPATKPKDAPLRVVEEVADAARFGQRPSQTMTTVHPPSTYSSTAGSLWQACLKSR